MRAVIEAMAGQSAKVTNDEVRGFYYGHPWERYWLQYLESDFLPVQFFHRQRCQTVMAMISRRAARELNVVDLGCGIGLYAIALCRRFKRARVVGIDLSPEQMLTARDLARRAGVADRTSFLCADAVRLPFRRAFDVVICSELLEHLPDPGPLLTQMRSLGGSDTQFLFSVPQRYGWTDHSGIIYRQILADGSIRECLSADQLLPEIPVLWFYHRLFGLQELRSTLREAGFEVVGVRFSGFMPPWQGRRVEAAVRRFHDVAAASRRIHPRLPGLLDGAVNRVFGNRYAANIIVFARLASRVPPSSSRTCRSSPSAPTSPDP